MIVSEYVILPNQQVFRKYIIFSVLTKSLREPDETASRAGVGPPAVVWKACLTGSAEMSPLDFIVTAE